MTRGDFTKRALLAGGGALIWLPAGGHQIHPHQHHWTMPHVRPRPHHPATLAVTNIEARVSIKGQIATTELLLGFYNPDGRAKEGRALLPVPAKATLKSFAMEGPGRKIEAELLPRKEARQIYDQIVSQLKDPAILEFAGMGAVKTGVFPVPPGKTVRLRLVYEELLTGDGNRVDYTLPRSQAITADAPPWKISLEWKEPNGIRTLYSPSHEISLQRSSGKKVSFQLSGKINPGPLRISILKRRSQNAVASFLSHPEEDDQGYFLMLLSPPERDGKSPRFKREVTLVMDRSGSMAGEKLRQARAAARQVLGGLEDGERFNLITYNEAVESFSPEPVVLDPQVRKNAHQFLDRLRVSGGTNIHGALTTALTQKTKEEFLPMVLFLTDGLPTIGETSEVKIRESIAKVNGGKRRIFTFGVGVDVNTPLLSRLADDSRAVPTFVLPSEDVELKVARVFRRLYGPVLSGPQLNTTGAPGRMTDLLPSNLPDFFEQDQIVLVGRYHGQEKLEFVLTGNDGKTGKSYHFDFKPNSKRNSDFVPRLWATRKIAILTEALRDLGADSSMMGLTGNAPSSNDPRVKELVDEIVRLSTEHGILTEYTAFLAREGEVFNSRADQNRIATGNFVGRALKSRSGNAGVNQEMNLQKWKSSKTVDKFNRFVNEDLEEESVTKVQQVGRKTFYARGQDWVDADAAHTPAKNATPVEIGSADFFKLVNRLIALNQQSALALGPNTHLVVDGKLYRLQ
jgi:Ca-activated chloride channel family protein